MNTPQTELKFASKTDELDYVLGLAELEMILLADSSSHLLKTLNIPLPVKKCRDLLPWKRGKTLLADYEKLGSHCTRIAALLKELELEQEQVQEQVQVQVQEEPKS